MTLRTPDRIPLHCLLVILCTLQSLATVSSASNGRLPAAFASIPSSDDTNSLPPTCEHEVLLPGDVPIDISSNQLLPLWKLALAGGVATMIGDAAMHPMDCIKTLQQSDEGLSLSLLQAARFIWNQSGGPAGFYRGMGTYVLTDGLGGALKFASYEKLTTWCRENIEKGVVLSVALLVCAAVAFVASSLVLVPGEFLKQQLQMGHYESVIGAVQGTFAKSGLLGFYAGYDGVLLRDIPYTVLELGLYDVFKNMFHKKPPQLTVWQEIVAAAGAGGITAYVTTPLDTIKTKQMVDAYDSGFLDCFLTTIHQHGVGAVFAGAMARIVWILPFTALYLPVYELLKRRLSNGGGKKAQ